MMKPIGINRTYKSKRIETMEHLDGGERESGAACAVEAVREDRVGSDTLQERLDVAGGLLPETQLFSELPRERIELKQQLRTLRCLHIRYVRTYHMVLIKYTHSLHRPQLNMPFSNYNFWKRRTSSCIFQECERCSW